MQSIITLTTLFLATLTLGAPTIEKRASGSITLFADKNYGGASQTFSFNVDGQTCIAPVLAGNIDRQASSVRLSGEHAGFNCRLTSSQNCDFSEGTASTWFFDVNIPDLSSPDYNLDNAARSISCGAV
ncbi:hypothetical protein K505DRAFT_379243 [Melanomma pulvis-pyrius CBS 109.77]|uniref:AA1-like domain-containing protein n=1 Tax=Melanomma pulvis-pyrius CBS 109.77 TaxID=1314802 RepID=A0A6A6WVJ6_9PLEO|nr:hypothetical protein K505DRAFT_379243 [Melanomma pulvis-pyrius CBS 109.77]